MSSTAAASGSGSSRPATDDLAVFADASALAARPLLPDAAGQWRRLQPARHRRPRCLRRHLGADGPALAALQRPAASGGGSSPPATDDCTVFADASARTARLWRLCGGQRPAAAASARPPPTTSLSSPTPRRGRPGSGGSAAASGQWRRLQPARHRRLRCVGFYLLPTSAASSTAPTGTRTARRATAAPRRRTSCWASRRRSRPLRHLRRRYPGVDRHGGGSSPSCSIAASGRYGIFTDDISASTATAAAPARPPTTTLPPRRRHHGGGDRPWLLQRGQRPLRHPRRRHLGADRHGGGSSPPAGLDFAAPPTPSRRRRPALAAPSRPAATTASSPTTSRRRPPRRRLQPARRPRLCRPADDITAAATGPRHSRRRHLGADRHGGGSRQRL
eukprot:SAG22_NODE_3085_length_1954_cov_53.467925_1_plen_390_part_00